jgi:hypothetical protein
VSAETGTGGGGHRFLPLSGDRCGALDFGAARRCCGALFCGALLGATVERDSRPRVVYFCVSGRERGVKLGLERCVRGVKLG